MEPTERRWRSAAGLGAYFTTRILHAAWHLHETQRGLCAQKTRLLAKGTSRDGTLGRLSACENLSEDFRIGQKLS